MTPFAPGTIERAYEWERDTQRMHYAGEQVIGGMCVRWPSGVTIPYLISVPKRGRPRKNWPERWR